MILATITAEAAFDVADYLNRTIPTACPSPNVTAWEEVRDALYAIANDTDAIVTDPADVKGDAGLAIRRVMAALKFIQSYNDALDAKEIAPNGDDFNGLSNGLTSILRDGDVLEIRITERGR